MIAPRALRVAAVAIAVAGIVDPAITREAPIRQPLAIAILDADGLSSAQDLRALLDHEYDVTAYAPEETSQAAACPEHGGCVVVSDGVLLQRLTAGSTVIGAVRLAADDAAVTIADVSVPGAVHVTATSSLRVRLNGKASRVEVFDGDVRVGMTDVADDGKTSDVSVPWIPIEAGARLLTVRAGDAEAHIGVVVSDAAVPVLFYEPEATWLGTFVRRALEADARFKVVGRTRLAPPVVVTRGNVGPLTRDALDDISVIVVTAPDLLTSAEVDLLERFIRVRGGSVVLLLDRRPGGTAMRLLPSIAAERRENEPVAIGALEATEILSFNTAAPGVSVIESEAGRAAVVSRAIGRGRVIVSGALDAWRYRDGGAFNGFWTALIADAEFAAGPTLSVAVDPPALRAGAPATVTVEWRTLRDLPNEITATGLLTCGEQRSFVRLWPGVRPGLFSATVRPDGSANVDCQLEVGVEEERASGQLKLTAAALTPSRVANLDAAIAAHGGFAVTSGDEATLAARVREQMPPRRQPQERRPMHSPWWILPFASCLGVEWWLRRRAGLR